ncbi:MAG TPA: hypothetical protein VFM47_01665 [Gaiellales bacterium]|jgi:hypothetical protein|nr:hypothetical protein [Gaiellales bacterium]
MPRSGEVGEQIFEQVEKLVAGGMNRTEAFAKISADSGRRAGTVAANYYRVARKRAGGSLRPRTRRGRPPGRKAATAATARKGARRGRKAAATAGADIDALAKSLVDSVQALAEAVKSQAVEVGEMRKKLDGVKKLLD